MDTMSKEFAIKVIYLIGLDINANHNIMDEATGNLIKFNDKFLKLNPDGPTFAGRNDIEFDVFNNTKLMSFMFSYFASKINMEDGRYISVIFPLYRKEDGKGNFNCREGNITHASGFFYRDSVKMADLIAKMNGDRFTTFDEYDSPIENMRGVR